MSEPDFRKMADPLNDRLPPRHRPQLQDGSRMCVCGEASEAPCHGLVLDEYDQAFYAEAFVLAECVRRFLNRLSTQRVINEGLLDADVVDPLIAVADSVWLIRTGRTSVRQMISKHAAIMDQTVVDE